MNHMARKHLKLQHYGGMNRARMSGVNLPLLDSLRVAHRLRHGHGGHVMSAGSIPVFVVRDFVRPFREQIDWPSFVHLYAGPGTTRMHNNQP